MAANFVTGAPYMTQGAYDRSDIAHLANTEEARRRKILEEQTGIQKSRLNELATLLAQQQGTAFNRSIPEIANTAQGQGFLETSGFGNALANKYKDLTADTSFELAKQGLSDRDLQIQGLGDISNNTGDLNTAALQRKFSVEDQGRNAELAKELAKYGVPAPAQQPSTFEKGLQYAGPILSGVGAVKGASKGSKTSGWDSLLG